jgi:hypothetical protein
MVGQLVELSSTIAQHGVQGLNAQVLIEQLSRGASILELVNTFVSFAPDATGVLAQHLKDEELRRRTRDEPSRQSNGNGSGSNFAGRFSYVCMYVCKCVCMYVSVYVCAFTSQSSTGSPPSLSSHLLTPN